MLLIIRGFLIFSLRRGLNFDREDRISSLLMRDVNGYYESIKSKEGRVIELTKEFSKEVGFDLK